MMANRVAGGFIAVAVPSLDPTSRPVERRFLATAHLAAGGFGAAGPTGGIGSHRHGCGGGRRGGRRRG